MNGIPLRRRTMVKLGTGGLFGLSLARQLAAADASRLSPNARAKSVIFLFLFGGPSQLETFDMKPEAPAETRGPFQAIASRTPELRISEHLPLTARVSDKFTVLKTLSHAYNDHSGGGHYVQTGHRWQIPIGGGFNATPADWPAMGAVIGRQFALQDSQDQSSRRAGHLPGYVVLPNSLGRLQEYKVQLVRPGEYAGWLGHAWDPVTTRVEKRDSQDNPYWRPLEDPELTFAIEGLARDPELTLERFGGRQELLTQFDRFRAAALSSSRVAAYSEFQRQALALVSSEQTRAALNVHSEPAAVRDRYGRHLFGQSTLVARRLVEAGVRYVTVHYDCVDGYSWDSHRASTDLQKNLLPTADQALSALLEDLDQRGMLDETLVVCMGEMGRTPRANKNWGRDHWSTLFPAVLAGAGIKRGAVVGETDRDAAYAVSTPYSPEDLAATIYESVGISSELRLNDAQGRPTPVVDGGRPIHELFG